MAVTAYPTQQLKHALAAAGTSGAAAAAANEETRLAVHSHPA